MLRRRVFISILTAVVMLFAMLIVPDANVRATGNTYYVSTTGSDSNPGTIGSPFRTIQHAASIMTAGDTCIVREGTYRETVTPTNSGSSGNPIIFKPYTGETVTVTGTDLVQSTWTQHSGSVYKTQVTLELGDQNQVFIDGTMGHLARWPNTGSDLMNPTFANLDTRKVGYFEDAELTQASGFWTGATVNVVTFANYDAWSYPVTNYILGANGGEVYFSGITNTNNGKRYFLSNKLEALDVAYEWYYDSSAGTLYVQAPGGDTPANHTVEVKQRVFAFDLTNKSYIQVEGINVKAASITTEGGTYNTFDGINASYVSHYATNVDQYASHADDSGLIISGSYNELKNSTVTYSAANCVTVLGSNNRVVNNLIYNCNYGLSDTALIRAKGDSHLIAYNTAYNSGRFGILLKGGISRTIIEHNDVYNTGTLTDDVGAIYSVQTDGQNTEIRYNKVHDNQADSGVGIYMDNGTSNFIIHHNLVYNSTHWAVQQNFPTDFILWYNNSLYNTSAWGGSGNNGFPGDQFGNQFGNNIVAGVPSFYNDATKYNANITNYTGSTPGYVNPTSDFSLSSTSPSLNAGTYLEGITGSYAGTSPDIGAYERDLTAWTAGHNFSSPPNPTLSFSTAEYRNRSYNSSFEVENDISPWTKTHSQTAYVEYAYAMNTEAANGRTGFHGLRLGTGEDGVEQVITGLKPNTTYIVTGWGKTLDSSEVRIGVKNYGGPDTYASTTGTTWARKTVSFTTVGTTATIYAYKSSGTDYAYVDDFGVIKTADESIIIDNTSAETTGTWTSSTSAAGYYGTDYAYNTSGTGTDKIRWRPSITETGRYNVYYRIPDGNFSRASNAPFTVYYNGGSQTVNVNEQGSGSAWKLLGTYNFSAGTSGYVELTDNADSTYVIADAIKFSKTNEIIVDNSDVEITGTWTSSTTQPNYYGTDYLYNLSESGAEKVRWRPDLEAGNYSVYYRIPDGTSSRATNAPFTVYYSGGSQTINVNEQGLGGPWVLLGSYYFAAGTGGYVELTDNGTYGSYVIADAMKFVKNDPIFYEAEDLATTASGAAETDAADSSTSAGKFNWIDANSTNDYIQYTVNVAEPGTYNIKVRVKRNNFRGIAQLAIDGVNQGSAFDQYNSSVDYVEYDLGAKTFSTAGNKLFKFTATGKNASSGSYQLTFDYIKLE